MDTTDWASGYVAKQIAFTYIHNLSSHWAVNMRVLYSVSHYPISATLIILKQNKNKQTNSMVWVRERTIPTERPPLVGEVIANFCG
jgi:hypothetical protein